MAATAELPTVDVVCGVIWSRDGQYLLAQRPEGRIWAGWWEFPGGKIEAGESAADAIARELLEELGIRVTRADPWLRRVFDYPHARVRLHFYQVRAWSGEPACLEGQALHWQMPGSVCEVGPLLPANVPVLRALDLPCVFPVTPPPDVPHGEALRRVANTLRGDPPWRRHANTSIHSSGGWLQIRRGEMRWAEWQDWRALCEDHSLLAIANTAPDTAQTLGAEALHLSANHLAALDARPLFGKVGASVHHRAELERAAALGLDYVILGGVNHSASHPGRAGLGWTAWAQLAAWSPLPVYAIGGLNPDDLDAAQAAGASGIAMIGAAWGDS
ncbi:MAG: Nudix family hydrolase [Burkholderiales bacterium]